MMKGTHTRGGRSERQSSKVYTSKGPRDRRVRLSAHTAIQFYDVQDRLGYDRPSKAIDWLMSKAKASIDNLTTYNETNNNLQPAPSKDNSNPSCSREPLPMDHHPELLLGYPPILQPNDTNSSFFRTTCLGFPGLANDPPLTRAGELDHLCLSLQTNFQDIISFERMDDGWNSSGGGDHIMNNSQQTIMFSQPQQLLHSNLVFHGQYQSSTDHSGQHFDVGFGVPARNNDPPRYDN